LAKLRAMDYEDDDVPDLVPAEEKLNTPQALSSPDFDAVPTAASTEPTPSSSPSEASKTTDKLVPITEASKPTDKLVPITILTGWLGSGKTTLLSYIVEQCGKQGKTVAIIQNEVSALGVEETISLQDDTGVFGEMLELGNGCVCCSVRNDFVAALELLMKKRKFDYVVLECSGLADPGPLARIFWVDEELESGVYLDGIVTLVDAYHLERHLREGSTEAQQVVHQIAYADRIILNKKDLVSDEHVSRLQSRLSQLNASARLFTAHRSRVPLDWVLHIKAFDSDDISRVETSVPAHPPSHSSASSTLCDVLGCQDHDHHHEHKHSSSSSSSSASSSSPSQDDNDHPHDHSISSFAFEFSEPHLRMDLGKLKQWLADLLWTEEYDDKDKDNGSDSDQTQSQTDSGSASPSSSSFSSSPSSTKQQIFRMKAVMHVKDQKNQYFLQAVQQLFDIQEGGAWSSTPTNKMVIIGRHLEQEALRQAFRACLVSVE